MTRVAYASFRIQHPSLSAECTEDIEQVQQTSEIQAEDTGIL